MSDFITKDDYKFKIQDKHLNQIITDNDDILIDPEKTAIQMVRDSLHNYYDVDAIFALTGDDRPKQVVYWCVTIALYFIHQRIPDKFRPDGIEKDYDFVMDTLLQIEDGQKSIELPLKEVTEGEVETKFRWGSLPTRSF